VNSLAKHCSGGYSLFFIYLFINFDPEHSHLFSKAAVVGWGFCGFFLVKSWAGSSSRERSTARAGRARVTAAWAASVGRSQGCLSCAAAQTKIPFFPCLVGSPSTRVPCSTNRNQTSIIAVSLIKHDFFTNLYKHFDLLFWCNRLWRFLVSNSFYASDGNTVKKFILGIFLICLRQEAKLVHLQSKLLWTVWSDCWL